MMNKIRELYNKYKTFILYAFFGVCTTIVNICAYLIFSHLFSFSTTLSTSLAWILSCLFAYLTNRKWVFLSPAKSKTEIFSEIFRFYTCRLITGLFDVALMYITVDQLHFNDFIMKVIANIIVIVLNYIASKLLVFKKREAAGYKSLIIYAIIFVFTMIFMFNSPQHPLINTETGTDSSVFSLIGILMSKGCTPYIDTFDHKGPLIYIINFFGTVISNNTFLIECAFLFLTFIVLYKTARLFTTEIKSLLCLFIAISSLFLCFEGGNLVEEYALLFIAVAQYIFIDYIINKKVTPFRLIISGICFAAICLLRINMIPLWIIYCIYVLIDSLVKKKYKELFRFIKYFALGILILLLPILIWLYYKGALSSFFDCYIKFNLLYSSSEGGRAFLGTKWDTFFFFLNNNLLLFSVGIIGCLIYKKKNICFNISYLIYILSSLLLISMSGCNYLHYGMILVPVIIYPISIVLDKLKASKGNITNIVIVGYIVITLFVPTWLNLCKNIGNYIDSENKKDIVLSREAIVSDYIKNNTDESDKIAVYGNWDIIYILSDRLPASRYSYIKPIGDVRPSISDEYFNEINENKPLLICKNEDMTDALNSFIINNNYEILDVISDVSIYKFSGEFK